MYHVKRVSIENCGAKLPHPLAYVSHVRTAYAFTRKYHGDGKECST